MPAHIVIDNVIDRETCRETCKAIAARSGWTKRNGFNSDAIRILEAKLAGFDSDAASVANRKRRLLLTGCPIRRAHKCVDVRDVFKLLTLNVDAE